MIREMLEEVKGTPSKKLKKGLEEVEGLDADAAEDAKRFDRHKRHRNWGKVTTCFHWLLFIASSVFSLVLVIAVSYMSFKFVEYQVSDPEKIGPLLDKIWNTFLVAIATFLVGALVGQRRG